MAKNMARIENGIVVNIEWCASETKETETMKDMADRPVGIGDTYENGKFYRDGAEILTLIELANNNIAKLQAEYDNMMVDYEYQLAAFIPSPMSLDAEPIENRNKNEKLYNALKRIVCRGEIEGLVEKVNVFLAVGKLTEIWFEDIINLINSATDYN